MIADKLREDQERLERDAYYCVVSAHFQYMKLCIANKLDVDVKFVSFLGYESHEDGRLAVDKVHMENGYVHDVDFVFFCPFSGTKRGGI